ncbi:MAG: 6-phosphofructokinase [Oscillospiraceae bacterium]|nr:6-phosphofructokinase [Oscillospiraceae bacterium]
MAVAVKRIGVLTSGGDAPGMNAAVRAVVRTALYMGIDVVGIRRGWSGLISGDVYRMDENSVNHIINRGGTILYTARSDEFRTEAGQKKAVATCKLMGIDGVVAIGGDGTFRGCLALARHGISVVGIPGTIDNDIGCTHYSIGYDSAANTAIEAIDRLRDTMQSHERCSVVEVMGHRAGNLAQYVGIATGATAVLVPEKKWDFKHDVAERIRNARLNGRTHFMVIVAEGAFNDDEIMKDPGSANKVADMIKEELGIDPRVTVLGHIQRGGAPNARDRVTATRMGYWAVDCLAAGKTNRVVCHRNGTICDMDMEEALMIPNALNEHEDTVLRAMTGGEFYEK